MASLKSVRAGWRRVFAQFAHPARVVVAAFGSALVAGAVLLALPAATESGEHTPVVSALFTAASALCVTGLVVVDTAGHWSAFGELVILGLIQLGGFGVMTLASLFGLLISGRMRLRTRLYAQTETKSAGPGAARRAGLGVVRTSLLVEAATAVVLTIRFATGYGESWGRAAYLGVFHAVSAFNNAGFALWPDNLVRFATDPWICLPIAVAVIAGGLGFPVLWELRRQWRHPRRWSLHTKITLGVSGALLGLGTIVLTAVEWSNQATLGALPVPGRLLAGFFQAVMPRTAGFNSVDVAGMHPESWLSMDLLMFVGGGSAGTDGGIKVTTFALLAVVIWAELRGEPRVNVLRRRLPDDVQRQALTIALLGVGVVIAGIWFLLTITPFTLDQVAFEVVSAFATVGLSTGITADLPAAGHVMLTVLMFIGRLGPLTLGAALALRARARRYELPEERPIVG
ncbi:TrkH family potassium uptake protein [Amycolatopsis ruanii]|uniref:TrkH family potassium uptake protein n=1 Tax=Amycolatopsis ruanii TaxID=944491 RepID=UPI001F074C59|nr:potassium transporter TrkG [Amycolatopsis ruanii]